MFAATLSAADMNGRRFHAVFPCAGFTETHFSEMFSYSDEMPLTPEDLAELSPEEISEVLLVSKMKLWERVAYSAERHAKPSNGCKIWCEPIKAYISPVLSYENSKLHGIYIFDLLAVFTCRNCSTCRDSCYALKAQKMYIETLLRRSYMTWLAMHFLAWLKEEIIAEIRKENPEFIRIHSSGDFFSQNYVNMWTEIARLFPETKFYYYTKVDRILELDTLKNMENVNQVSSILPEGERNYGDKAFVAAMVEKYGSKVKVCPYHAPETARKFTYRRLNKNFKWQTVTVTKYPEIHCGTDCRFCMSNEFVVFYIH